MARKDYHDPPRQCPITGEPLYISELTSANSEITIRGKFRLPLTSSLDDEQRHFLEVFLRSKGVYSTMEKELGLSYPTLRGRLDALLSALDLEPIKSDKTKDRERKNEIKQSILQDLEEGRITAEEAKTKLREKVS